MTAGTVLLEMSMSLDGFVAGSGVSVRMPMGNDRGRIHDWMFQGKTAQEARTWEEEQFANIGAVIMGNTTFDVGVGPWGDNPTFHAPCFVVAHNARETVVKDGGTSYTFVADGIERALEQARAAAGAKDIMVMGGANLARQYVRAGLLDEMRIHLVPILLSEGVRLFDDLAAGPVELQQLDMIEGSGVIHLRFGFPG
jgi:dihydrofolate reductase